MLMYVNIDNRTYKKEKPYSVSCTRKVIMPDGESWQASKIIEFQTMKEALEWLIEQDSIEDNQS